MKRWGRILLVILAVAFGVRVAYVAVAKGGVCPANAVHPSAKYACGSAAWTGLRLTSFVIGSAV